jgi:predicted DNA-binding transcriptional regulator AlpA
MTDNPAPPAKRAPIDTFITITEVQKMVHLSRSTVNSLVKRGEFPPKIKCGNRSLWSLADMTAWIERKKAEAITLSAGPNSSPSQPSSSAVLGGIPRNCRRPGRPRGHAPVDALSNRGYTPVR